MNLEEISNLMIAKPFTAKSIMQTSFSHSIITGLIAKELLSDSNLGSIMELLVKSFNNSKEEIIAAVSYTAAIHDIGKLHPYFQEYDERIKEMMVKEKLYEIPLTDARFSHEKYGAKISKKYFKDIGIDEDVAESLSETIKYHHEKDGAGIDIRTFTRGKWNTIQNISEARIRKFFNPPALILKENIEYDAVFSAIFGIVVVSDWIASSSAFSGHEISIDKIEKDIARIKSTIKEFGLNCPSVIPSSIGYSDISPDIIALRPLQVKVEKILKKNSDIKFMIIEAPTGEGKTEAAMFSYAKIAKDKKGVFIAQPTTATGDSMFHRLSGLFEKYDSDVRLTHSTSWIDDNAVVSSSAISSWLNPNKRALLFKNNIGTIDQIMMSVLKAKHSIVRQVGIIDKVIIFDEVHAYDAYMSEIIERLLSWLSAFDVPVIMMSATLPTLKKKAFIKAYSKADFEPSNQKYPLITYIDGKNNILEKSFATYHKRTFKTEIVRIQNTPENIMDIVAPIRKKGGNVLIVVNTVNYAQTLAKYFKREFSIPVTLLHARMPLWMRKKREAELEKLYGKKGTRPFASITIATQVVEQGLDVDFDFLITEIAPIDLLLQRDGRKKRFLYLKRPGWLRYKASVVLVPPASNAYTPTELIYPPFILKRTIDYISKHPKIKIPQEVRAVIDYVYVDINSESRKEFTRKLMMACHTYINKTNYSEAQAKETAISEPSKTSFDRVGYLDRTLGILDEESIVEEELAAVSTRLAEPTLRVIFLSEADFYKYNFSKLNRNEEKELFSQSMSILASYVTLEPDKGYSMPAVITEGKLTDFIVFEIKDGQFRVKHKKIKGYKLTEEYGLEIEKHPTT